MEEWKRLMGKNEEDRGGEERIWKVETRRREEKEERKKKKK